MMVPPAEVAAGPTAAAAVPAPESRRVIRSSLDTIAHAVSGGVRDALSFPWAILRYSHTATRESGLTAAVRVSRDAPRHLLQGHARSAPRDRVADAGRLRELPQWERARDLTLRALPDRLHHPPRHHGPWRPTLVPQRPPATAPPPELGRSGAAAPSPRSDPRRSSPGPSSAARPGARRSPHFAPHVPCRTCSGPL